LRHRVVLGGNIELPGGVRVSPFLVASTGGPFNITTGADVNGDSLFTDRPAFATDPAEAGLVPTSYGLLDPTPEPGAPLIARNLGEAPGFAMINLRLSRTISLGGKRDGDADAATPPRDPTGPTGLGMPGGFGSGRRGRFEEGSSGRSLTISVYAQNAFNRVNPAAPVANISSPYFGQSLSSSAGFGFGRGGGSGGGAAASRRIELEVRLSF
jgi:hypothetical protein